MSGKRSESKKGSTKKGSTKKGSTKKTKVSKPKHDYGKMVAKAVAAEGKDIYGRLVSRKRIRDRVMNDNKGLTGDPSLYIARALKRGVESNVFEQDKQSFRMKKTS